MSIIRKLTLVQAAIGLGQAKVPGVTDRLLQLVMSLYRAQDSREWRREFLVLVCKDFGVDSEASKISQTLLPDRLLTPSQFKKDRGVQRHC